MCIRDSIYGELYVKMQEEEKRREKEKEKALLERWYAVPDQPSIIVYPSPTAKAGRFDCSVMSLSVLLDYRPEDNKEHSFEASQWFCFYSQSSLLSSAVSICVPCVSGRDIMLALT